MKRILHNTWAALIGASQDRNVKKVYSRRIVLLAMLQTLAVSVLAFRAYHLQVRCGRKYRMLSDNNRTRKLLIPPIRGKILDRMGIELATCRPAYRVFCALQHVGDVDELLSALVQITKQSILEGAIERIKSKKFAAVMLYDDISWKQLSDIEFSIYKLPGIYISPFHKRHYPFGASCAHLIGYTKTWSGGESGKPSPERREGVTGVEYTYDDILKGTPGVVEHEIDARSRKVGEFLLLRCLPGNDVTLTVDASLQQAAFEIMGNNKGAVVVLDISSGDILALCSAPSYDNNLFINGLSRHTWESMNDGTELPFMNRAVALQTEPASTFKVVAALAALRSGAIDVDQQFLCSGSVLVGDRKFRCWNRSGHGLMNLEQAITCSCNCYFYNVGRLIDIDSIIDVAREFGFAEQCNTKLPGEAVGILPSKAWRAENLNSWRLGDTLNVTIGHGYLLATPIQLAVFIARMASGVKVLPRLCMDERPPAQFTALEADFSHMEFMRHAMFKVVNSPEGTAFKHFVRETLHKSVKVAGKTGTVQVFSAGGRRSNNGIFVGYAPYSSPKYAIAAFTESSGSSPAVGIARRVFGHMKARGLFAQQGDVAQVN
ncbi:putative cell division protein FtsI/penicillin-binding protein 2 [Anaplasma centrale str. Israel]|uniref:Beta-lactamase n=1 Tax=Anaplasma centrale (strain Israel) TaxID=574556 RepID=D1ATK2_ANACI|nr:penicillin-binding protein 2 [Anaplasma centrale]ACZ48880.1 putative cell division protein FtsI/penicillin-binding protein 2 [Anaplasma centrale str. Israel]